MNDSTFSNHLRSGDPFERRITAITPGIATERRPIVLVVGMHRSGTSLCSHILSALGVDMADTTSAANLEGSAPDNPKGHWERWEIVALHEQILGLFKRGYFTRFHDFPFPVAWWADPRVAKIRREITAFVEGRMDKASFGFKDPRTARLLPIWRQIISELGLEPKFLFCLRNPVQVARSLKARDGLPPDQGEYRWLAYNADFFRNSKGIRFRTIEYETWFKDPATNLAKLRDFLDLPSRPTDEDVDLAIGEIVNRELRHDDLQLGDARQPLVRSIYELLRRADRDPSARDQVERIATQFLSFQQLQRGIQQGYEDTAAIADRLPSLEQEIAALRDDARDREKALAETNARAEAAEARLAEGLAEAAAANAHAMTLEARLAEGLAEAAAANTHAMTLEARLTEVLAEADEQRRRLDEVERDRDDRGLALEGTNAELAAAHNVIAEREAALAAARATIEERQAALDGARNRMLRAEAEGVELRRTLARCEEEVRRSAAEVGSARDEATALREQLEAAHAVGVRLVAAFRSDVYSAAAPPIVTRRSWWLLPRHVLRFHRTHLGTI